MLAAFGLMWSMLTMMWAGIRIADRNLSDVQRLTSALILGIAALVMAALIFNLVPRRSRRVFGGGEGAARGGPPVRRSRLLAFSVTLPALLALIVPTATSAINATAGRSDAANVLFCPWVASNAPQPEPRSVQGAEFCPVDVNDGTPISGPFSLYSRIVAPLAVRRNMILVSQADPKTCDALGNAPASGTFFMNVRLDSDDGTWNVVESLGYAEAVTIGRTYKYVRASPQSIDTIKGDRDQWAASGNDPADYPGIVEMPSDATVLASFHVGPGEYRGTIPPCP